MRILAIIAIISMLCPVMAATQEQGISSVSLTGHVSRVNQSSDQGTWYIINIPRNDLWAGGVDVPVFVPTKLDKTLVGATPDKWVVIRGKLIYYILKQSQRLGILAEEIIVMP